MKKQYSAFVSYAMLFMAVLCVSACGGSDDNDDKNDGGTNSNLVYDVIKINGENYACYGFRSPITYRSTWNMSQHTGEILLPCGNLSDAQNAKYKYDSMYTIYLKGKQDLGLGSKLENYTPTFENIADGNLNNYISGSATITSKNDKYITVKFENFAFNNYTLDGTVQLVFHED